MKQWFEMKETIKQWVVEVGKEQKRRLQMPLHINSKSAVIDLVTEVDIWSENELIAKIKETYPEHHILSEESGRYTGEADYEWVIDPIDGTTNFAHGFPIFCISIAVKYRGETVIGFVYAPALEELYEAVKGNGAYLNGKRLRVSQIESLKMSVLATGFPYDRATDPDNNVDNFNNIVTQVSGIRRTGSAAFDLCQVAAGRFDGYWELKLNSWDVDAGILLIQEAGGKIYHKKEKKGIFIIAGNPAIYSVLKEIVRGTE